jgi:lipid II:glycine glycyltransferase (peptidoglycan interpeptide bridge formation enzyme)
MINYSIKECDNHQEWNRFVESSNQGSIFCSTHMLELFKPYKLIGCYNDNEMLAGIALFFEENSGNVKRTTNPFMMYQGLLLKGDTKYKDHQRTTREYKVMNYIIETLHNEYEHFSFNHSFKLKDLRPFQWFNYGNDKNQQFRIDLKYTCILDLYRFNSFEEYFKNIRELRRREYKKAIKNNIQIQDTNDIYMFIDLLRKTYSRQDIHLSPEKILIASQLVQTGLSNNFGILKQAVTPDGKVASMVFFVYGQETAYYLFGTNDPEYRNTGAASYLMVEMIKDTLDKDIRYVDFCGANSPYRGDYKISFNAELSQYFNTSI